MKKGPECVSSILVGDLTPQVQELAVATMALNRARQTTFAASRVGGDWIVKDTYGTGKDQIVFSSTLNGETSILRPGLKKPMVLKWRKGTSIGSSIKGRRSLTRENF